jgi:hypothetical protein
MEVQTGRFVAGVWIGWRLRQPDGVRVHVFLILLKPDGVINRLYLFKNWSVRIIRKRLPSYAKASEDRPNPLQFMDVAERGTRFGMVEIKKRLIIRASRYIRGRQSLAILNGIRHGCLRSYRLDG